MTVGRLRVGLAAVLVACGQKSDGGAAPSAVTAAPAAPSLGVLPEEDAPSAAAASSAKAAPDPTVQIPAGRLVFGSLPGDRGRDPVLEPLAFEVDLGAFDIDRAPYPNEPGKAPRVDVSRAEAEGLCEARGRRLCTEAEWERACKGPDASAYAGNVAWRPECAKSGAACASGFGVLGMGALREWTASDVAEAGDVKAGAAVRGSAPDAQDVDHRCARRASVDPSSSASDLGFRCCGGPAQSAPVPPPRDGATFERTELSAARLGEMFASVPQLAKLSGEVKYFDEEAAEREVTSRADAGVPDADRLTTAPLVWRPALGEEILVVAAQVGADSVVAAFHRLPDGRHRFASALVLRNDPGPVVLVVDRSVENRLEWATCWQCRGESGRIAYRDDRRVVITQE